VLALLLAVVFVVSTRGGGKAPLVPLPSVAGMPVETAKSALQRRGFGVRVAPAEHAGNANGTVARIRPTGTSLARGSLVTLIPSSGPAPVRIPLVTGFSQQAATSELEKLGFVVQPTSAYASAPLGSAVGTTPQAGATAPPGSTVQLIVSAGPAPDTSTQPATSGQANGSGKWKDKGKHWGSNGSGNGNGDGGD
jgi:serine/threonine-protein kinase